MHLSEEQLNDLADGTLTGAALAEAQAHTRTCAECRVQVEAIRAMLQRVSALPRQIQPERDLRADIWAQADRKTLWSWRYQLAAAAVILIAVTAVITASLTRNRELPVNMVEHTTRSPIDFVSLEPQYRAQAAELQDALREQRDQLSPETVRILEENLRIIDTAIQEARAALARDPQSAALGEMWRSAYQRKLDLLKQAARSTAET